jgi:hypothetical protein
MSPNQLSTLLTPGDAARYEQHLANYNKLWKPVGEHEETLVQALADAWWRLGRLPLMEEALYAKGALQFAEKVSDVPSEARPAMLRLETWLAYEKQFRHLASQERHLARHAAQLKTDLETARKARNAKEAQDFAIAATLSQAAEKEGKKYDPEDDGFEFSRKDLDDYLRGQRATVAVHPYRLGSFFQAGKTAR